MLSTEYGLCVYQNHQTITVQEVMKPASALIKPGPALACAAYHCPCCCLGEAHGRPLRSAPMCHRVGRRASGL